MKRVGELKTDFRPVILMLFAYFLSGLMVIEKQKKNFYLYQSAVV